MMIETLLFAGLREGAGVSSVVVEVPEGCKVGALVEAVARAVPSVAGDVRRAAVAINQEYVGGCQRVARGDEVALIPPVSGG